MRQVWRWFVTIGGLALLALAAWASAPAAASASAAASADAAGASPAAGSPAVRVLMLASFDKDLPSQRHLEEGLATVLAPQAGRHALFVEYLDAARTDPAAQQYTMAPYLSAKYGSLGIGVVVATSTQAADFLASQRGLLPQARRIYVDVPAVAADRIRAQEPAAMVIAVQSNYPASIREAMRLLSPRRLVVVGEARDAAARERLAQFRQAAAQVLPPELALDYWIDLPLAELLQRSAQLGEGSALYYLLCFQDGKGALLTPYEVARRITERASVPMVSQWETLVGSGVVGGYVVSQRLLGEHIGRALLAGPAVAGQVMPAAEGMRHVYDWRQLRRWGLDVQALPAGSVLMFREPSVFELYRGTIFSVVAVIAGLLVMLGLLLASNRARQRALAELAAERSSLARRVAQRTAELDDRLAELARRNDDLTRAKTQLALLANTDGLTGLANRRHFDEVLDLELRRLQRSAGSLSLLMLDVDCFKAYNDHYGHLEGDRCLKAIAGLLAAACRRPADMAARFGGEEFILLLPETQLPGAQALAQHLMHELALLDLPHAASTVAEQVTLSIGVLSLPCEPATTAARLLQMVDAQLYRAKSEGRNRMACPPVGVPA
ncbi:GGDEF domain-containing protein [Aquabacterium sp.]|uniref:GGDEF domain-containing protein n=1 Tax=Aquabacterium sp. TaxID=1872578 RepID=UPI002B55FDF6|nr:diguanylate cyclase [Aquabacterium sp.]HSW06431.1 diguanylate cyclase [Aquabacterium sp.]